jgi:hypothetical protein
MQHYFFFGDILTMNNAHKLLEEKEKVRYEILRWMYERTNGAATTMLDLSKFFETTNLLSPELDRNSAVQDAINYLCNEELLDLTGGEHLYSITHKGVKEVEQSIKNPERSTDHFSSPVIQIFNAPVGNVQTGNNNNSYISQVNNTCAEVQNAIQDLKSLVGTLPENHQKDASEVIEDLQEEITNPTKLSRLKAFLVTLWALGKDIAGFANSVSAIAQRFGIDLSSF